MVQFNKKGFEMSINIIVMLVIGLTILGLVISFVTGLVGDATSELDSQLSQTEDRERQNALDASGIFAASPSTFTVEPDGEKRIFIKVYNPTDSTISFETVGSSAQIFSGTGQSVSANMNDGGTGTITFQGSEVNLGSNCNIDIRTTPTTINAKEQGIIIASISPDSGCNNGDSFFLTLEFEPETGTIRTEQLSGEISSN